MHRTAGYLFYALRYSYKILLRLPVFPDKHRRVHLPSLQENPRQDHRDLSNLKSGILLGYDSYLWSEVNYTRHFRESGIQAVRPLRHQDIHAL